MVVSAVFSLIGAVISYYFIDITQEAHGAHTVPLLSNEGKRQGKHDVDF